jgi:HEAT repeat protein
MPQYQRPNLHVVVAGRDILEDLAGGDPIPYLSDDRSAVRRLAAAACSRLGLDALEPLSELADSDPDEGVRAEAIEVLGLLGEAASATVLAARADSSMRVVEAATTALGEIGDPTAVPWLIETSANHENALVREAAIAALGSIGDQRSLPTLLEAVRTGKPQIRRRAVVALTAFEGPEVEAALTTARLDRNPMVREVAEMVLGRSRPDDGSS